MTALEEIATSVASVADKVGASAVRVGGGWRGGAGVVIGHRCGPDQRAQHPWRRARGHIRRRAAGRWQARRHRRRWRPGRGLGRHGLDDSPGVVRGDDAHRHARVRGDAQRQRAAGDVRFRVERGASIPRTARPPDLGQPRAHGATRAGFVGKCSRGYRRQAHRAQHESPRRRLLPGTARGRIASRPASRRCSVARARSDHASASASRRPGSHDECAGRLACLIAKACWYARSSRTARQPARDSPRAT